ncbi:MAG: GNAT family N-acetyltransferase [Allobranchiibius sp.]
MTAPRSLLARGDRVWVHTVVQQDLLAYERAVRASWDRIAQWNPVSTRDLAWHLGRQSPGHRTFLIHANDADTGAGHDLVGKVNISNVVRGRFQNGTMGYDAYDPYVGRGLFADGLRLVVDLAFAGEDRGMGLHRVEANVRPGNARSAGVLRSLGFRREGHVRSMLLLESGQEGAQWRDHDVYAVHRGEWPATPYAAHRPARVALLVSAPLGGGVSTLARSLAAELGLPVLDRDLVPDEAIFGVLAASPNGGIVAGDWAPQAATFVRDGLEMAGFDPSVVPRVQHDGTFAGTDALPGMPDLPIEPLGPAEISRIALRARAAFA